MREPRIYKTQWDNWYGYLGHKKVIAFTNDSTGTQEQHAKAWLAEMEALYNQQEQLAAQERAAAEEAAAPSIVVLCLNDFPIGVYTTPELATEAAAQHKQEHYAEFLYHHYHQHTFTLNKEAGVGN